MTQRSPVFVVYGFVALVMPVMLGSATEAPAQRQIVAAQAIETVTLHVEGMT